MSARIQIRRDTTANWAAASPSPVLEPGELGIDTTLNQIKIGDGSTAWSALKWATSVPVYSSPSSLDLNNATNSLPGIYRFSTVTGMSNVPVAPIDIKTGDGGITMFVLVVGTIVIQQLWTDGDGTPPQKMFSRLYDGAWKPWIPISTWGVANGEGVDLSANSLTLKGTASTALTVDGDVLMKANVTVGDASTDVLTVQAGTAALPSVAISGDTDTGIYSPAANKLGMSAGGVSQVLFDNAVNSGLAAVFRSGATFANIVDVGGFKIQNLADPGGLTDAANVAHVRANRLGQVAVVMTDGIILRWIIGSTQGSGNVTAAADATAFTLVSGTTSGNVSHLSLRAPANQTWVGIGLNAGSSSRVPFLNVTSAATSPTTVALGAGLVTGQELAFVLLRTV